MPQICSVCRHDKHQEIDQALLDQQPLRTVADQWSVSKTALIRHRQEHLPAKLVKARAVAEEVEAGTLLEQLQRIGRDTREILEAAKGSNNHELALKAIARVEKQLELLARLLGELDESTKIAVGVQVNAAPSQNLDLAKLSAEELQTLRALIIKAQPMAAAGGST